MGPVTDTGDRLAPGPNEALAREVVERMWQSGVRTFVVCPGGRNAPLVETLAHIGQAFAEVLHFFDERSAAYFALGRATRDRRPVAVVTTSGTAAAELLPAVIEAYYEGQPLVAVTADRPARYRGTGAPQAIDQRGLFGPHVTMAVDLDRAGTGWSLDGLDGPAHVNVCFEEPLLDHWRGAPFPLGDSPVRRPEPPDDRSTAGQERVRAFLAAHRRPLVILGALQDPIDQNRAGVFCRALGAPVLAEASSHLWGSLDRMALEGREASALALVRQGLVDSVLRVGDVPSFRLWRDLEDRSALPVLSVSRRPWPGLTRGELIHARRGVPLPLPENPRPAWTDEDRAAIVAEDLERAGAMRALLARYPASEPALFARLSRAIPRGASVYLGNSLPIREWNQFAAFENRDFGIRENRGANGIDGQLSTFLGAADPGRDNWAIVGDLTALYDLTAPWALRYLTGIAARIVIVNNGGGRIFGRLFANPNFQNLHRTSFEGWAALWSLPWTTELALEEGDPVSLIELRPDEGQTTAFWAAWSALRS